MDVETSSVEWKPSYRIIPSHFRPQSLFERVSTPEDLQNILEVEALTNPSLRDLANHIPFIPLEDRVTSPNASLIMMPFVVPNTLGSRFSDGSYGVFYASNDVATAIAETVYHRERFLRTASARKMEVGMQLYSVDLVGELHDLRGQREQRPSVYRYDSYLAIQSLEKSLRSAGSNGILYDSVRREEGECVAVFRPRVLSNARPEQHLSYVWNGRRITEIYEKREFRIE